MAIAVLVCGQLLTSATKPKPDGPYYIQGTQVNLRSAPNGDSAVQLQLDVNEKAFVVKRNGEWAFVSLPGLSKKGWVSQQFLAKQRVGDSPAAAKATPPKPLVKGDSQSAAPSAKPGGSKHAADAPEKTADDFAQQPGGDLSTQIVITRGTSSARPAQPAVQAQPAEDTPAVVQPESAAADEDTPPLAVAPMAHYDTTQWQNAAPPKAGSSLGDPRATAPAARSAVPAAAASPGAAAQPAAAIVPPAAPAVAPAALQVESNFATKDGGAAVLYPAVKPVGDDAERSARDFIPDDTGAAALVPPAPASGTTVAVALDHGVRTPDPAPAVNVPVATKAPQLPSGSKEQGKPSLLFNGDATSVVTSPMMLEGSFFAVGGRDMGKISGSDVNLRAKPDTKGKVLGKLQAGDKLYLTTLKNNWYEVSVPARDLKGWVSSDFVHEFPKVEINGSQVRLRGEPNTSSEIKDTLDKGEVFYEYERKSGWVKVASSASGINGWIKGDYVSPTDRSPSRPYKVQGDDVNFRSSPQVDADIIAKLPQGTPVAVFGRNAKWSYIQVQGRYGWMYSEYLLPGTKRGFIVPSSPVGLRLIARAKAMEGTPYVWGGESDDGVDCSGLIYKILLDEGASGKCLPRRASEQMAQLGQAVDKENLQPGDLVFFTTYKPGPSHVGIYLGDGNFIHASSAKHQVAIGSLSENYYKERFVGARRISEDEIRSMKPE